MPTPPFELPFASDRVLEGLAREVITNASADQFLSERHKAFGSALAERLRLARDLHDGLLQSLTGAALQLEAALRLIDTDPRSARQHIREAQHAIIERQQELRAWIGTVRGARSAPSAPAGELVGALQALCERVGRWGPRVQLDARDLGRIPIALADHIHHIVAEGLANVVRHARARIAAVEVRVSYQVVHVVIADDGCGFPFRGRYDLATLDARRLGPASLKERVAALGGKLVLTSSVSGTRIEIALPVHAGFDEPPIFSSLQNRQQKVQS